LCVVGGRAAETRLHGATEVTRRHAERTGEVLDRLIVEVSGVDVTDGVLHEPRDGVHRGLPWSDLWPAPEAGPEARTFCLGRVREKGAAILCGRPRGADGATVDSGCRNAHEEDAVETVVAGRKSAVTGAGIEAHG
jgi:hypothetical protein